MPLPSEVTVTELSAAVAEGAYVLDVREPYEYIEGHVPGAASVPMGTIPERHGELPRDRTVYLICAVGERSMQVARYLDQLGFDVRNVAGGTNGWIDAGFTVAAGAQRR
ncbi:MAG TPA: rhodanese-like domain-containing protein [Jiangellaceae bacterium]|nr:rhodanese-like domain-containing protein [Jiangellaceae bacterium]